MQDCSGNPHKQPAQAPERNADLTLPTAPPTIRGVTSASPIAPTPTSTGSVATGSEVTSLEKVSAELAQAQFEADSANPALLLSQIAAALRHARYGGIDAVQRIQAAPIERPAPNMPTTAPKMPTTALTLPTTAPQPALTTAAVTGSALAAPSPRLSQPLPQPSLLPAASAGAITAALTTRRQQVRDQLHDMFGRANACVRCPRHHGRLRAVAGTGSVTAKLFIVAETPDQADEKAAKPMQGEAGALLDRMLAAMGLHRDEVWLTHLCLCRGATDSALLPSEAAACSPWLRQQWEAINPQVLVILGEPAARFLLRHDVELANLRGQWHTVRNTPARATWSLADVLADPAKKREVWADLLAVMHKLGLRRPPTAG
ncbi:MAG: uracil-DNA glycosylase [Myxococcales bacterium]|nr:uracil-DNA glycosylase [Myxococcales bacterium]